MFLSGEVLDVCCGVKLSPKQVPDSSRGVSGLLPCLPALKNFYIWPMGEVTGPESTVAENLVCLSLCHAKGLLLAVLPMAQPSAI